MRCLDAPALFELFAGAPSEPARDAIDEHLDGCERCREMVAAYALVADDDAGDAVSPYTRTVSDAPSPPTISSADTVLSEPPPRPEIRRAPGEIVEERYLLERVVGEGGMGVVWAARDRVTGRAVALKMLKIDSPDLARRALREAQVASVVGHPNVVEVRAILHPADTPPILVMDLLEGESLAAALARRRTLPPAEVVEILTPLVGAVRAAHARGVLHRDLKPQNVFLAREREGAPPVVMLLDFGLAKIVGHEVEVLTRTGAIVGTPHYMAPEQLYGEHDIDRRADVWAIGVIAYECLSGRRPLEGGSYAQLVRSATRRAYKPLAAVAPDAPRALALLVDRMLAHDRDERPELAEVHAALDALARSA